MRQKQEYDFIITLKHPDYKIYNVITVLMCLMTVTASVFSLLHAYLTELSWLNIFLNIFIVANLAIAFIYRNKQSNVITFKWCLYAAAFLWLLYPLHIPLITFFYVVAALLERQIKFPQEIGFNKNGITFNTFPFKNFEWQDLKNVVLKDNILTLDFTNNKIIQRETETVELTAEEQEFNEFCMQHLNV